MRRSKRVRADQFLRYLFHHRLALAHAAGTRIRNVTPKEWQLYRVLRGDEIVVGPERGRLEHDVLVRLTKESACYGDDVDVLDVLDKHATQE